MHRTLMLVPYEIGGIPLFGLGWLLGLLAIGLVIRLVWAKRQQQSISDFVVGEGRMWALAAIVVSLVAPVVVGRVALTNVDGEPIGIAVRGYGVLLLTGILSAIWLAAVRARRRGIDPEIVYSMAPWVIVCGIAGARVFYVIQYRDQFIATSWRDTLTNMLAFTEGGLVVYGAFIGGVAAGIFFTLRYKLPVLKLGDALVPCMFLGLFLGRIGCLLNGCCYGGRCEDGWMAVHFPPGSPVYQEQLTSGELLGMQVDAITGRINDVRAGSLAADAGIAAGNRLVSLRDDASTLDDAPRDIPAEEIRVGIVAMVDQSIHRWMPEQLPDRALPVFAAQVLSSMSGLTLCVGLCAASFLFRRDGAIMLLGFAGYAVVRFGLEAIRVDEGGQFGTMLSISQWVSVAVLIGSMIGFAVLFKQPAPSGANAASPGT